MKAAASLVSLCTLAPIPLFGIGADEASRPSPPSESHAPDRAVRETPDTSDAVKAGQDQVLLPALRGLAIGSTAATALELQRQDKDRLVLDGFSDREADAIRKICEPSLGQPVSLRSLDELTKKLEIAFRSFGRPFMQVSFPEQEITSGVIAVLIQPARAGQVLLSGKPAFGMKFAADAFRTRPGDEISGDVIVEDVEWMNENPLRRASISYADGSTPDSLDLTLKLAARKVWRVYAGVDNQLSNDLGDERLFLGFQYGDLFSLDHRITAQYTSALNPRDLQGVSGIYELPLPWRHLLQISSGYTESESNGTGPIDQSGQFSRLAVGYRVPLPRWHAVSHEWRMGLEYRNNDYTFSNSPSETVKFFNIETGWKGRLTDHFGMSRVDASLSYNPGQGVLGSNDEDYIALGGSGAESLVARLEFERTLKLGENATLVGRGRGQWADSSLLSSDQLSAGGYNRVRGFDETVGYASTGIVATLELQSRFYQVPRAGSFQGLTFIDAAALHRDEDTDTGQLASVGIGVRWRFEEMLSSRIDLGIPIDHPDDLDGDPRIEFSISTSW
ncbi:MAG: ShlB/FhaC/HecB family hemolysin secretion/activation protein [Luteolibacter sp.]|uniref:ShlB/FhaC/HecB family hemolysin secretion/activation protein n=1 Tax=Luteolibacter sp. TaxID=1962973 RepID=UPI003263D1B7